MQIVAWLLVVAAGFYFSVSPVEEKSVVILTPDPDGKVGQVTVATQGGQQVLSAAGQMTIVTDPVNPPSPAEAATPEYIERNFAVALSIEPLPPVKFTLYFQSDSTDLDPASTESLPRILAAITLRESRDIGVHGHADRSGSADMNLDLSLRRAMAIRDILLQNGIRPDSLEVTSHGEGNPLVPTPDDVAEPRNRRVEVVVR